LLPISQKGISFTQELILLFWQLLQHNPFFESYLISSPKQSQRISEILMFYFNEAFHGMYDKYPYFPLLFIFMKLSSSVSWCNNLSAPFPNRISFRDLPLFKGSYLELLVLICVHGVTYSSQNQVQCLDQNVSSILLNV
jgi:hypothetical protein